MFFDPDFGSMFGFLVQKRRCLWTSVERQVRACRSRNLGILPVLSCVRVIFKDSGIVGPENQTFFSVNRPRRGGRSQISN